MTPSAAKQPSASRENRGRRDSARDGSSDQQRQPAEPQRHREQVHGRGRHAQPRLHARPRVVGERPRQRQTRPRTRRARRRLTLPSSAARDQPRERQREHDPRHQRQPEVRREGEAQQRGLEGVEQAAAGGVRPLQEQQRDRAQHQRAHARREELPPARAHRALGPRNSSTNAPPTASAKPRKDRPRGDPVDGLDGPLDAPGAPAVTSAAAARSRTRTRRRRGASPPR